MSKIIGIRLTADVFTALHTSSKETLSKRTEKLLQCFIQGEVKVEPKVPKTTVGTSISVSDDLAVVAKEKAEQSGLTLVYVITRLLEMEANNELHQNAA